MIGFYFYLIFNVIFFMMSFEINLNKHLYYWLFMFEKGIYNRFIFINIKVKYIYIFYFYC